MDVRRFLLQTSILDRLNGSLCDTVTAQKESAALLDTLVRENLFVVPLDDKRHWFRYHHLFADVLHAYLLKEHPDQVPILHKCASKWYEQNGSLPDAIRHALAAEEFGQAAALIERAWPEMDGRFQSAIWLGWAKALPDQMVSVRPVMSVGYAWALLNEGEMEAGEVRLQDAERWLDPNLKEGEQPQEMVFVDEEQFRSLPASIATARAYIAQALGDVPGTVMYTSQALDLLPEQDYTRRGPASAIQGLAYWGLGELDAAHHSLSDAMAGFRMAGNIAFAISGTYGLADIRVAQGRLRAAMRIYEQALQFLMEQGNPTIRGEAELYLGLSQLHREMGNKEEAAKNLLRCEQLGEQAGLDDFPHRWRVYLAQIKVDQQDLSGALDLLDEAERLYFRTPVPNVQPIAAWKTQVWVRQGRLREVFDWVREQGLSVDEELSYLREFEHLTLAKALTAQYRRDGINHSIRKAIQLLNRMLKAAQDGGRAGSAIEILILKALAHQVQGDIPSALASLKGALTLAEPEGYVHIFVDQGPVMARLLYEALSENIESTYIHRLLAAFPDEEPHKTDAPKSQVELIEPLSERELEVLQLIAEGLTNQEIADRLYLSLHTIKIHARNIYAKLGVKNRTQATAKGKIMGLLLT
jgi:LuxR family maltose regulon positive regulatory protein